MSYIEEVDVQQGQTRTLAVVAGLLQSLKVFESFGENDLPFSQS